MLRSVLCFMKDCGLVICLSADWKLGGLLSGLTRAGTQLGCNSPLGHHHLRP